MPRALQETVPNRAAHEGELVTGRREAPAEIGQQTGDRGQMGHGRASSLIVVAGGGHGSRA